MQPQTFPHLFYFCSVISNFWSAFQNWWFEKHKNIITLTERNILFGWHDNTTEKKDIPKRETPFFFTLKSLSNKQQLFFTS